MPRGICSLRPGVPGLSETIRVRSIVDRFLERNRIYVFGPAEEASVFLSSADWMPRNFFRRVEIAFPVVEPELARQVVAAVDLALADNVRARVLRPDGTYERLHAAPAAPAVDAQAALLDDARARMQRAIELVARGGIELADAPEPPG